MGGFPSQIPERRCYQRFPCTGSAEILEGGASKWWGSVSDISQGGCYIELPHPLPLGSTAQLRLTIAGIRIEATAQVSTATPTVGMGLKFVKVSPEQERHLAHVIELCKNPTSPPASIPDREIPKPHQRAALVHLQLALAELQEAMRIPDGSCENALHWTERAIHEISGREKARTAGV